MRKVLGPPAGAEAFADADGLGVAAAADGAAGALATRAAGVAAADAAAAGDAEAPLSAAGVDGAGATAGAATAAGVGAAGAAPIAPIVAEGPTGGSFWASAGLIAPSASPAANAVKIAARNAGAERGRLAEAPAAVMFHHAPVISELLQMRAN
jgi:hypothetical protein